MLLQGRASKNLLFLLAKAVLIFADPRPDVNALPALVSIFVRAESCFACSPGTRMAPSAKELQCSSGANSA